MSHVLEIPNTLALVANCWKVAEVELQRDVKEKYADLDEETITTLFYGNFSYKLRSASIAGHVEMAFRADLQAAFSDISDSPELNQIPSGLVADVSLHRKEVEKITGGDLGLTIFRPYVSRLHGGESLHIGGYERGLLCQAKIKRRNGRWGGFTKNQRRLLPDRLKYSGLLLYSYSDEERHNLDEFKWQLCQNASWEEVERWVRSGAFPQIFPSDVIIQALGNGYIGTGESEIIREVIRTNRPCLTITIFWSYDRRPPEYVSISSTNEIQTRQPIWLCA